MFEEKCIMSIYLAYGMLAYTIASIYYTFMTMNIGTPFKNSLTPEQLKIKKEAAYTRGNIFYQGIVVGIILIFIFKPFADCKN